MNGAIRSDITRDTFHRLKHFSRVIKQQGRVDLDAEWNEQIDILLYYLRTLTMDLVGPRVVQPETGFQVISPADAAKLQADVPAGMARVRGAKRDKATGNPDFYIRPGHYYINGLLVENEGCGIDRYTMDGSSPALCPVSLTDDQHNDTAITVYLVYLDAWERQVTFIEDREIREVALGTLGPDTTTRARVEWQIKVTGKTPTGEPIPSPVDNDSDKQQKNIIDFDAHWEKQWADAWQPPSPYRGMLKAQTGDGGQKDTNPCITPPNSRYRGVENQLYRVEIHKSGPAGTATFVYSRENASVIFEIKKFDGGDVITLEDLGRDRRFGLRKDDWVQIVDDAAYPQFNPAQEEAISLFQVESVDYIHSRVKLKDVPGDIGQGLLMHPILRRWERLQADADGNEKPTPNYGTMIKEDHWYILEDGIQIQFPSKNQLMQQSQTQKGQSQRSTGQAGSTDTPIFYRSGDYWLIPARTATGDIEWPRDENGDPIAVGPRGVEHYYAPLAFVILDNGRKASQIADLRRTLMPLWKEPSGFSKASATQASTDGEKQEVAVAQSGGQ